MAICINCKSPFRCTVAVTYPWLSNYDVIQFRNCGKS